MIMSNCDWLYDYENSTDVDNVFEDVLKAMMFSFGDVEEPLKESVDIVYHILRKEMNDLLTEAERVALVRKKKQICHEDMLFLMRKNKGKLKRLIKYLQVMDDSPGFLKSSAFGFRGDKENGKTSKKKRADICKDFLASIEDCGEYMSILEDDTIIDVAHRNMLVRRNAMTEWMSLDEYTEFTETILKKSFCEKQMLNDFEKWLLEDRVIEMGLTTLAFEIVRFLARETVSKIVDLALIIKSRKNEKAKSPEFSLEPFNFYKIAKECNLIEFSAPSNTDRTSKNADRSYHASNGSKEPTIVHIQSSTSIPGTSKDFVESNAPTKETISFVNGGGKKNDGVKELHIHVIPSVIRVKDIDEVDDLHDPLDVPETPADFPKDNSDSDSIAQQSTISTNDTNEEDHPMEDECVYLVVEDDSDSQSKQSDRNTDDTNRLFSNANHSPTEILAKYARQNPQLREKMSNYTIENISDDEIKDSNSVPLSNETNVNTSMQYETTPNVTPSDSNTVPLSDETNVNTSMQYETIPNVTPSNSNTVPLSNGTKVNTSMQYETTPNVTPSDSRNSSNYNSEDIIRKYYEKPSENYPQTPIKPEEIVQAAALFYQHSWSNRLRSTGRDKPKIKLLCLDEHACVKI